MSKKNNLLSIMMLCLVCLAECQYSSLSPTTNTMTNGFTSNQIFTSGTYSNSMITSPSYTSGSSVVISSSTMLPSTGTNGLKGTATGSAVIITSNTIYPYTTNSNSSASSASMLSTMTTFTATTASIVTSINVNYRYIVRSNYSLQVGIINNSNAIASVQRLIDASFNLSRFNIVVKNIRILPQTKAISYNLAYPMLVNILFTSVRNDCDINCIYNSKVIQGNNFSLPLENGTAVIVYSESGPLSATETTTVKSSTGESPPGLAAKLGMGLGISIIVVLIIVEIAVLYWKYGLPTSSRQEQYGVDS